MSQSSPGSAVGAPVHTGRALRRVSGSPVLPSRSCVLAVPRPRRPWRALLVAVLAVLGTVTLTPAAQAHEGTDPTVAAVLDRIAPDMPGVTIEVETTRLGPQFVRRTRPRPR